jgi:hypothetical protein
MEAIWSNSWLWYRLSFINNSVNFLRKLRRNILVLPWNWQRLLLCNISHLWNLISSHNIWHLTAAVDPASLHFNRVINMKETNEPQADWIEFFSLSHFCYYTIFPFNIVTIDCAVSTDLMVMNIINKHFTECGFERKGTWPYKSTITEFDWKN